MIRINLGKDGLAKGSGKPKFINLTLPPQVQQRIDKLRGDVSMLVALAVAVGIAAALPLIVMQIESALEARHQDEMKVLREKANGLTAEVQKLSGYQKELNSYQEQKNILSSRLGSVRDLLDARGTPVNVLDSLSQSLPSRAWLATIDLNLVDPGSLTIAGSAYSNEEISDYLDKLGRSVFLSDVLLDDVGSRLEEKTEVKTFSIAARPKINGAIGSATRTVAGQPGPPSAAGVPPGASKEKK